MQKPKTMVLKKYHIDCSISSIRKVLEFWLALVNLQSIHFVFLHFVKCQVWVALNVSFLKQPNVYAIWYFSLLFFIVENLLCWPKNHLNLISVTNKLLKEWIFYWGKRRNEEFLSIQKIKQLNFRWLLIRIEIRFFVLFVKLCAYQWTLNLTLLTEKRSSISEFTEIQCECIALAQG